MSTVSLPMYDFAECREETEALGSAIARAIEGAGWPARWKRVAVRNHAELEAHWLSPSMAISHSCGLPFVESLEGKVKVVGTFAWKGITNSYGLYRSRIVAASGGPLVESGGLGSPVGPSGGLELPSPVAAIVGRRIRPVINNLESLSGWTSLAIALDTPGLARDSILPPLLSGSHAGSLEAIRRGEADIASIDPVTWELLGKFRPSALDGVSEIGLGPWIPATPLIAATQIPSSIVRRAVRDAILAEGESAARLGIEGFLCLDDVDYRGLKSLIPLAETRIPRNILL